MATASKSATSRATKTTLSKIDSEKAAKALREAAEKAEREAAATPLLDAFLKAEDAADKASKKKSTTKGVLMGATLHGDRVTATDGRVRQIVQGSIVTNGWEKVARELAAAAGMSDEALAKRAKELGAPRNVREVEKF